MEEKKRFGRFFSIVFTPVLMLSAAFNELRSHADTLRWADGLGEAARKSKEQSVMFCAVFLVVLSVWFYAEVGFNIRKRYDGPQKRKYLYLTIGMILLSLLEFSAFLFSGSFFL